MGPERASDPPRIKSNMRGEEKQSSGEGRDGERRTEREGRGSRKVIKREKEKKRKRKRKRERKRKGKRKKNLPMLLRTTAPWPSCCCLARTLLTTARGEVKSGRDMALLIRAAGAGERGRGWSSSGRSLSLSPWETPRNRTISSSSPSSPRPRPPSSLALI